jgi:hypothetical protein
MPTYNVYLYTHLYVYIAGRSHSPPLAAPVIWIGSFRADMDDVCGGRYIRSHRPSLAQEKVSLCSGETKLTIIYFHFFFWLLSASKKIR